MQVIPAKPNVYEESDNAEQSIVSNEPLLHKDPNGDDVLVHMWVQYPSYDLLFGTPASNSSRYEKEVAFFEFRDGLTGEQHAMYLDSTELSEFIQGFEMAVEITKKTRPDVWTQKK